jgi:hypothetical protein
MEMPFCLACIAAARASPVVSKPSESRIRLEALAALKRELIALAISVVPVSNVGSSPLISESRLLVLELEDEAIDSKETRLEKGIIFTVASRSLTVSLKEVTNAFRPSAEILAETSSSADTSDVVLELVLSGPAKAIIINEIAVVLKNITGIVEKFLVLAMERTKQANATSATGSSSQRRFGYVKVQFCKSIK